MDNIWDVTPLGEGTKADILAKMGTFEGASTHLLDFGAGSGRYTRFFMEHIPAANICVTETDPASLKALAELGVQVFAPAADSAKLPYADNSFDYVFSSNVVEHIPNPLYKIYLEEIHRVLKPGGRFLVGAPNYPIKRYFDMHKAYEHWQQKNYKMAKYYLFDDPTHVNKLSIYTYERDLGKLFKSVMLEPRRLLSCIPPNKAYRWRILANKFFGVCVK